MNTDRITSIGRNALYFEDYVLAIQYFNQVIRLKPYLSEPYLYRSIAKIQLEDYQGALQDCNAALERNPFSPGSYYARGYIFRQLNQFEKAEKDYSEALRFSPENRTYMLLRADTRAQMKHYDAALAAGEGEFSGEVCVEEADADIVAHRKAGEEVLVKEILALQHGADAGAEIEEDGDLHIFAAVGNLGGGTGEGLVCLAVDTEDRTEEDTGSGLNLDAFSGPVGEGEADIHLAVPPVEIIVLDNRYLCVADETGGRFVIAEILGQVVQLNLVAPREVLVDVLVALVAE